MLRLLTQTEGGEYVIRKDLADSFKRRIVALCLRGRAERFLILSSSQPSGSEESATLRPKRALYFPFDLFLRLRLCASASE
jgi:hypothetical protein